MAQYWVTTKHTYRGPDTCMGIPIPRSLREFSKEPPASKENKSKHCDKAIKSFANQLRMRPSQDEIDKAIYLAAGADDIVVLLQRPQSGQKYSLPFSDFVSNSPSLKALDELLRLASNGTCTIQNVSVLEALPFQVQENYKEISDEQHEACHELVHDILETKKPKVVISCHSERYRGSLKPMNPKYRHRKFSCEIQPLEFTEGGKFHLVRSFHPGLAVNCEWQHRPELKALLMHQFVAAFAILRGVFIQTHEFQYLTNVCNYITRDWNVAKNINLGFSDDNYAARTIDGALNGYPYYVPYFELQEISPEGDHLSPIFTSSRYALQTLREGRKTYRAVELAAVLLLLKQKPFFFQWLGDEKDVEELLVLKIQEAYDWLTPVQPRLITIGPYNETDLFSPQLGQLYIGW